MKRAVASCSRCFPFPRLLPFPPLPAPPAQSGQAKPNTRLFGTQDLGLLEAPDREQWQKPDQIMDAIGVAEGSKVAELGAAGGWFTLQLAERVGPNGRVYAEDIQRAMLDGISRRMQSENLTNVTTVLGTPSDPHLPPGLDAALISDAFHEMDVPEDPNAGGHAAAQRRAVAEAAGTAGHRRLDAGQRRTRARRRAPRRSEAGDRRPRTRPACS